MTSCARSSATETLHPRARKNETSCGVKAWKRSANCSSLGDSRYFSVTVDSCAEFRRVTDSMFMEVQSPLGCAPLNALSLPVPAEGQGSLFGASYAAGPLRPATAGFVKFRDLVKRHIQQSGCESSPIKCVERGSVRRRVDGCVFHEEYLRLSLCPPL